MDINKDINEYFKNDTILLIMDFLYSQDLIDSLWLLISLIPTCLLSTLNLGLFEN